MAKESWRESALHALRSPVAEALVALALLVPLVATAGQYAASGFWGATTGVDLLFWPGVARHLAVRLPVWLAMGAMLAAYVAGIAWLARRRALSTTVLSGVAALALAQLAAAAVNALTGWREMQKVASMDLAGRANRAIFSLWHNPTWEELVFRGLPLVLLLLARRRAPGRARWAAWCYYAVPAVVFAAYHVPGHGPARIVDTLVLSTAFAALALKVGFFAPLVLHDVFDAVMTLSLAKLPNIPKSEVSWLAAHFHALNSTWTITLLLWLGALVVALARRRWRARIALAATAAPVREGAEAVP